MITALQVKELREKTGAGIMDCKVALRETGGDAAAAIVWLRTKGLSKATKKAGRTANDGLVAIATNATSVALVEVNSETDFVARNENFQKLVSKISDVSLKYNGDSQKILEAPYPDSKMTVNEKIIETIAMIGENITLRRASFLTIDHGVIATYLHNAIGDNMGKIATAIALRSNGDKSKLQVLGRQLAMHIAATNPLAVAVGDLNQDDVEHEKAILVARERKTDKPEGLIDKIVAGRLSKYFEEVVLLEQILVIDGKTKIADMLNQAALEMAMPIEIIGFRRFALGESA